MSHDTQPYLADDRAAMLGSMLMLRAIENYPAKFSRLPEPVSYAGDILSPDMDVPRCLQAPILPTLA